MDSLKYVTKEKIYELSNNSGSDIDVRKYLYLDILLWKKFKTFENGIILMLIVDYI